jgi:hypothetical protein
MRCWRPFRYGRDDIFPSTRKVKHTRQSPSRVQAIKLCYLFREGDVVDDATSPSEGRKKQEERAIATMMFYSGLKDPAMRSSVAGWYHSQVHRRILPATRIQSSDSNGLTALHRIFVQSYFLYQSTHLVLSISNNLCPTPQFS